MDYVIRVVLEDGLTEEMPDREADLSMVCQRAIRLADELGIEPGGGASKPRWVDIYKNDRMELSIQVIAGGLRNC